MKLNEVTNLKFKDEMVTALKKIKGRKTGGRPTAPHKDRKKDQKKNGQRSRSGKIDLQA